jgi:hypothetical protein
MDFLRFDIYLILKVPLIENHGLAYTSPVQDLRVHTTFTLIRRVSSAADSEAGFVTQLLFHAGTWGGGR